MTEKSEVTMKQFLESVAEQVKEAVMLSYYDETRPGGKDCALAVLEALLLPLLEACADDCCKEDRNLYIHKVKRELDAAKAKAVQP